MDTLLQNTKIKYWTPAEFGIWFDQYANEVSEIITKDIEKKEKEWKIPTVALRSREKLLQQFEHSLLTVLEENWVKKIIWNAVILPTSLVKNPISLNQKSYNIGELESVIIDPNLQIKWLWTEMLTQIHSKMWTSFDILIMATLNPAMSNISTKYLWYQDLQKLPKSFEKEWLEFFVQTWKMSEEDFLKNWTSLVKFNNSQITENIQKEFINLFLAS